MKIAKILRDTLVFSVFALSLSHCASSLESNLENARFELDQGNYTAAIEAGTAALQSDPDNAVAARVLASAYLGRSGIDYLDLAEGLTDLANSSESNFRAIANVLPDEATLADLRSAITTLESLTGIDEDSFADENLADAAFDLALMQMIEHFAIGVYEADFFGTLDVDGISSDEAETVQDDLINFDNRMIAAGVDETEGFIAEVRQTYCILEDISVGDGFTASEYRALVACQLSSSPSSVDTVAIDANIANCNALNPTNQSAGVEACYDADTTL